MCEELCNDEDKSVGDCIVLAKGGKVPFVLMRQDKRWRMVGECYVHGIMRGEALEKSNASGFECHEKQHAERVGRLTVQTFSSSHYRSRLRYLE